MENKKFNWGIEFFGMADIIIGLIGFLIFFFYTIFFFYQAAPSVGGLVSDMLLKMASLSILFCIGFCLQIILGVLIIKSKPIAIMLNLFLTPLIAIWNCIIFITKSKHIYLEDWLIIGLIVIYSLLHLYYFTRPKVKEQFK